MSSSFATGSRVLWLSIVLLLFGAARASGEKKVTICHVPPGNLAHRQTISVGESAIRAHLAHGDATGECPTGCRQEASLCDDGDACTSDSCTEAGECAHAPVNCDDGETCTRDMCDASSGCVRVPNDGATCDDGNDCTERDACVGTTCRGSSILGCCATSEDCNDGDGCTNDDCVDGRCSNQAKNCSVADKCLAGFCDAAGSCQTMAVSCDDQNVCTDDRCDPATGCFFPPASSPPESPETSCDDGTDNDCDGAIDGADSDCFRCGDGVLQPSEECDDGNTNPFDGCDQCILVDTTPG